MWTLLYHQTFKRRFHILVYLYSQCFYPGLKTSWLGPFFAKNYFETVWLPRCIRVEPFQAVPCYGPSLSKGVRPLVADLWEERLRAPDSLGRNIVICTAIFSDILQYCENQKYICNNSSQNLYKSPPFPPLLLLLQHHHQIVSTIKCFRPCGHDCDDWLRTQLLPMSRPYSNFRLTSLFTSYTTSMARHDDN